MQESNDITNKNPQPNQLKTASLMTTYVGPIPPSNELERYERVLKGSADRIVKMAEEQQKHRINMEAKSIEIDNLVVKAKITESKTSQILGFIIAMTLIISGTICIIKGHDWAGSIMVGTTLASIIAVFFGTKKSEKTNQNFQENK